jgi:regulator of protease activity HflC (stomatin/prohibitin superfamily)
MLKTAINKINKVKTSRTFITVIKEYERGVKLNFGKFNSVLQPGLRLNIPYYHSIYKVNLTNSILNIPTQSLISKDNITFTIDSSVQYKVIDAQKAILNVCNLKSMLPERCQMSMRQILSSLDINGILHGLKDIPNLVKSSLSNVESEWGIEIINVQIRDIQFDESVKRAMGVKAEAERNAEAKLINADADVKTAEKYALAATIYKENPITMRLREFQLWTTVSQNKNTQFFVIPSNLLDFPKNQNKLDKE